MTMLSELDQASRWEDAMASIDIPLSVRAENSDSGRVSCRTLDELTLVDMECGPLAAARTGKGIARSGQRLIAALLVREGTETVSQGDTRAVLRPGDLLVWDSARPALFEIPQQVDKRFLLVPDGVFEAVNGHRAAPASGLRVFRRSPATRLLDGYLDALAVTLAELGPSAAGPARNAALELLAGALRPGTTVPVRESLPVLRAAIESWIDQHLDEPGITPATVATAHAVSVRTVHRAFAGTGDSLGSVVRMRRLLRARRDLETTRRPVAAIAAQWGFADPSHLTRSFRRQFGLSPADYRERHSNGH